MVRKCIIWDLDSTLFDIRHRLPFIKPGEPQPDGTFKPNWKKFHEHTHLDTPYAGAMLIYKAMSMIHPSVILTGRSEMAREVTARQLRQYECPHVLLLMRPEDCFIKGVELKSKQLDALLEHNYWPLLAFEDQPDIIRMYRERGIETFAADDTSWRDGTFKEVGTKP